MGIRFKVAESGQELDDVFRVRHQVYAVEENYFKSVSKATRFLTDRFDAHPRCANLIAYDGAEAVATLRLNLDTGAGLPPEDLYDFAAYREEVSKEWRNATGETPVFGSAGMLAVRKDWRSRRDVIRALFKLAAEVGRVWNGTHVLVTANHRNTLMYKRVGFVPLGERIWVEEIGEYIVPMAAEFSVLHDRTVGHSLAALPLVELLAGHFQWAVFRSGEPIFQEGDVAEECYIIDSGSIKITRRESAGCKELTFAVLGEGEVFGELALIDAKPRSADAIAVHDSELIVLRRDRFLRTLEQHTGELNKVLGFLAARLRRTDHLALLLAYGSPRQRLQFALGGILDSARAKQKSNGSCVARVGPTDLAAAAGTEETEARSFLAELAEEGYCSFTDRQIRFLVPEGQPALRGPRNRKPLPMP